MKKIFTMLVLVVLSGQAHAGTCGELSYAELISATQNGTVAKAIECPKKEEVAPPQPPGPAECRQITLAALTNLQLNQNVNESVHALRDISQNFNCTDDVLENARQALQKAADDQLKAAAKAFRGR